MYGTGTFPLLFKVKTQQWICKQKIFLGTQNSNRVSQPATNKWITQLVPSSMYSTLTMEIFRSRLIQKSNKNVTAKPSRRRTEIISLHYNFWSKVSTYHEKSKTHGNCDNCIIFYSSIIIFFYVVTLHSSSNFFKYK